MDVLVTTFFYLSTFIKKKQILFYK